MASSFIDVHSTAILKQSEGSEPSNPTSRIPDIRIYEFFNRGSRSVRIGRNYANHVILKSEQFSQLLSRCHCIITMQILPNGEYVYALEDKNTTNGCYVGSDMIPKGESRPITHGTIISLGGPESVIRNGITRRNPFCFQFLLAPRPLSVAPPRSTRTTEELQEDYVCAVCQEDMVDAHILPCGHCHCGACIWNWAQSRNTCPECRMYFDQPFENATLDNAIDRIMQFKELPEATEDRRKRKAECVEERIRLKRTWLEMDTSRRQAVTAALLATFTDTMEGGFISERRTMRRLLGPVASSSPPEHTQE
ncbi:hypothetical protein CYMTET_31812 [Cymbomonas tetramitiformis]|uniref:Uncharacterized protein n=1 Tax=Cymbomonas tetramitiformis TaxID=36881 RepID=A0AAE0FGC7_9CHLO|nr:hypothetical protein CYMTET_41431 [Cymbomonas tetramitiformis]KAK3259152.1 hypothetical protein CYMTET_31812 [Cymbomonas tetramitiformis]